MGADRFAPTPNFGERKNGALPRFVILHFTVIEEHDEACAFMSDPQREVSAHYVLGKSGEFIQLVDEKKRAWHAGKSFWAGLDDLNSHSIGIEIVNNGASPFTPAQYDRLIIELREISERWSISPDCILGHNDIAIGRKFDPGPWFDWPRLDKAGVSAPPKAKISSDDFVLLANNAGYQTDVDLADLLMTVRLRHGATPYFGPLRSSDLELLKP